MKSYQDDTRTKRAGYTNNDASLQQFSAAGKSVPETAGAATETASPDTKPLVQNAMKLAAARERQRILLQLHDHVIQNLALAKMKLETAIQKEPSQAVMEMKELPAVLERAMHAMRHLEFYSPPPILKEHGLRAALNGLGMALGQEHGFVFCLEGSEPTLQDDLKLTLYQMTRELLINAVKHAAAHKVGVTLKAQDGTITIVVSDDGRGFDPATFPEGMGLSGISTQLRLLGGELRMESAPGKGTSIQMLVPPLETPSSTLRKHSNGIKIVLVDDHRILREGLKAVLEQEGDISVVGEADHGAAAVESVCRLKPDLVIMDISMPGMIGLEAARTIRAREPEVEIVILTMHDDKESILEALKVGAKGFVLKSCAGSQLLDAIRCVARKETFLSPSISGILVQELMERRADRKNPATLSRREQQVLLRLAQGNCTKEIAYQLGINSKTIETYRQNLMKKLHLSNVADLTRYAIREGIVEVK